MVNRRKQMKLFHVFFRTAAFNWLLKSFFLREFIFKNYFMKETFLRFPQDKVSTTNAIIHSQFFFLFFISGRLICIIMTLQFQLLQFRGLFFLFSPRFRMKSIILLHCVLLSSWLKVFNLLKITRYIE